MRNFFFQILKIMLAFLNELCYYNARKRKPGVAKFGIALEWGSRGRWFESSHSDHVYVNFKYMRLVGQSLNP